MDIKNVYIVFDMGNYTKEMVKSELKKEGYKDKFAFDMDTPLNLKKRAIEYSDEIWCFGNCEHEIAYLVAKELGSDIWKMD